VFASQILLETAMRNYTALSVGETIVIDVGGTKHWLDIVETRPEPAISLLGSLDLEVEFAPPKVFPCL
jgi:ubiquitin fusion degradation protein 1